MSNTKLCLDGDWRLTSPEMVGTELKMSVPGDNYTALLSAGVIPDPYWGTNEKKIQKYADMHWILERDFTAEKELLEHHCVILELERVDTLAAVFINGKKVLTADNAFRRYRTDVRKFLKSGKNNISVKFDPVIPEGAKRNKKLPFPAPMVGCCPTPHLNLIRKPICHGGWDWGIQLLVSGIYSSVCLYGVDDFLMEQPETRQIFRGNSVKVEAGVRVEAFRACTRDFIFRFNGETKTCTAKLQPGWNYIKTEFIVNRPKLWWPNGYGGPHLYLLEAESGDQTVSSRIGLREIKIITRKDRWGRSFTFRVNGVSVFAKGANWIPIDAFPSRQTPDRYEKLLESMRLANMNMVRVWGGGQYEQECFYDYCDEKGLLVWQDLMFSCCLYPATQEFFDDVAGELEYQVPRLRKHASLALWCGDNELRGAVSWRSYGRTDLLIRNHIQYDRLNLMLGKKVNEMDPDRVFWPSSPSAGQDVMSDGWHDDTQGDMHFWEVGAKGKEFNAYRSVKPRFCSEFGYHSFPSMEMVNMFCPEEQKNIYSPVMALHQKFAQGNSPMVAMFEKQFRMPSDFAKTLYLSQVQQAIAIKTGVEYWRSSKPRCMGTLFWQLNENWPTVSLSSLEYSGKWKPLMYNARRFYAPVMITAIAEKDEHITVFAVSDLLKDVTLKLTMKYRSLDGTILKSEKHESLLKAGTSMKAGVLQIPESLKETPEKLFCEIVTEPNPDINNGEPLRYTYFFAPEKKCELYDPELQMEIVSDGKKKWEIKLRTAKPAFHVVLDLNGLSGIFSDNDITVIPGDTRVIHFFPGEACTEKELREHLTVMDLYGSYH